MEIQESQLLYEQGDRTVHVDRYISEEVIEFLTKIQFGYKGALYEHINTRDIIQRMMDPHVLILRIGGRIAITGLFSKRTQKVKHKEIDIFYIRYLAADEKYHGRGTIVKYGVMAMDWMRRSQERSAVFFNYVQQSHQSSYRFIKFVKYSKIGATRTVGFSRNFPRKLNGIERIQSWNTSSEVSQLLQERYSSYNAFNLLDLASELPYYIYRKDGEIVAGVQPHYADWRLNNLPGLHGKLAIHVVPKIPILNRVINPKDWKFVGFEGFYYKPGHIEDLKRLMEGVLAELKRYSALMWFDENDVQLQEFLKKKNLGLMYHFAKSNDSHTMALFHMMSEDEIQHFKSLPFYISALDNL